MGGKGGALAIMKAEVAREREAVRADKRQQTIKKTNRGLTSWKENPCETNLLLARLEPR